MPAMQAKKLMLKMEITAMRCLIGSCNFQTIGIGSASTMKSLTVLKIPNTSIEKGRMQEHGYKGKYSNAALMGL